jgi:NTP pyrophosphatase (non-canonical NTP hydrolase)
MSELQQAAENIYAGVREKLGLDHEQMQIAQVLCVAEEAGEFVGAYRRFVGMARRNGPFSDVQNELADVVIAAYTAAEALGIDLEMAIDEKLGVVMTRGWKETSAVS